MGNPLVSIIIIDYKKNNPYLKECLDHIQKQTYTNYEIILLSDHPLKLKYPKLTIKHYNGKYVSPAKKRDDGAKLAKGEILAFIDDDAYPSKDWLTQIISSFKNHQDITAVGGPGINPPDISVSEAASGWFSASPLGAGIYTYRFLASAPQFVEDYPSMNLSVLRGDFLKVGGFDSNYWPGEDTKLCLDLTHKLNKKIFYNPKAQVFHHRRPLWLPHLRQNGNFGLHRGFFARVLPKTSRHPIYFGPAILTLGLPFILLPLNISLINNIQYLGQVLFSFYLLAIFFNAIWTGNKSKSLTQALISIPVIFITHYWYGLRFLQGLLFTKKLSR
jgi:glycosyltransferase involved in cell wall biosynthesis